MFAAAPLLLLLPAALASPLQPRQATSCGVKGWDKGTPSAYNYDPTPANANYAKCSAQCLASTKCLSFGFDGAACLLYAATVSANVLVDSTSPVTFYDRGCASSSATSTTARTTSTTARTTSTTARTTSTTARTTSTTASTTSTTARTTSTTASNTSTTARTTSTTASATSTTTRASTTTTLATSTTAASTTRTSTTTQASTTTASTTTQASTTTAATTTTASTTTTSAATTTSSAPDCNATASTKTSAGSSCGSSTGGPTNPNLSDLGFSTGGTPADCALNCGGISGCVSFGFSSGGSFCNYYGNAVSALSVQKDYGDYTFYDMSCFTVTYCP